LASHPARSNVTAQSFSSAIDELLGTKEFVTCLLLFSCGITAFLFACESVRLICFAASVGQGATEASSATSRDEEGGSGADVKK
jgi:hypothetical protein